MNLLEKNQLELLLKEHRIAYWEKYRRIPVSLEILNIEGVREWD